MIKIITLIFICLVTTGCSTVKQSEKQTVLASNKVQINAKHALEQCGQGNVKKVTISGFSCKKQ